MRNHVSSSRSWKNQFVVQWQCSRRVKVHLAQKFWSYLVASLDNWQALLKTPQISCPWLITPSKLLSIAQTEVFSSTATSRMIKKEQVQSAPCAHVRDEYQRKIKGNRHFLTYQKPSFSTLRKLIWFSSAQYIKVWFDLEDQWDASIWQRTHPASVSIIHEGWFNKQFAA